MTAGNTANKQPSTANINQSSCMGDGSVTNNSSPQKSSYVTKRYKGPQTCGVL